MPELSLLEVAVSRLAVARNRQQEEVQGLVKEVRDARAEVVEANLRLQQASAKLRQVARRSDDETAPQLLVFANAHLRMTGAFAGGIRRASTVDRLLENAEVERRERREELEREVVRQEQEDRRRQRSKANLTLPDPEDAFDEIYGGIVDAE